MIAGLWVLATAPASEVLLALGLVLLMWVDAVERPASPRIRVGRNESEATHG